MQKRLLCKCSMWLHKGHKKGGANNHGALGAKQKDDTMAYITAPRATGFNLTQRIAEFRAAVADAAAKRKVYNQTFNELNALSNRELGDLGLYRGAIKSIALEAAYGK